MDEPKERPIIALHAVDTPAALHIQKGTMIVTDTLIANGYGANEILSILLSTVWVIGNVCIDHGMTAEEHERLALGMEELANLLRSAKARRDGTLA